MSKAQYRPSKKQAVYLTTVRGIAKTTFPDMTVYPDRVENCRQAGLTPSQAVSSLSLEIQR